MNNNNDDIRRTSLRIDESLALEVDRLAENDGRSFNNQIVDLIKKGIMLVESEKRFLKRIDPVHIVHSASDANGDDPLKHRDAPETEPRSGKKGEAREMA